MACVNGYFVAIEVKAPRGKPSDLQLWNIDQIGKSGGIGIILYPDQFDQFKEMVEFLLVDGEGLARGCAKRINERK